MSETYKNIYYIIHMYIFFIFKTLFKNIIYLFINNCHANISHLFTSYYLLFYVAVWEKNYFHVFIYMTYYTVLFKATFGMWTIKKKKHCERNGMIDHTLQLPHNP